MHITSSIPHVCVGDKTNIMCHDNYKLGFVCRHSSESWEAVGALARHVVLKAPDKADSRAGATEAAVALMTQLPNVHQHQFVLFAARLARTPKVTT